MDAGPPQVAKPKRFGGAGAAVVVVALTAGLVGSGIWWWRAMNAQIIERVEHDHGLQLPPSVRDIQAMSDTIRFLDHGRSAVFVIDTDELPELIETLDRLPDVSESTFVPGNARYQPRILPWRPGSQPLQTFGKGSPPGGDWLHVEIYLINETSSGIWFYSDWNQPLGIGTPGPLDNTGVQQPLATDSGDLVVIELATFVERSNAQDRRAVWL